MRTSITSRLLSLCIASIFLVIATVGYYNFIQQEKMLSQEDHNYSEYLQNRLKSALRQPLWDYAYKNVENIVNAEIKHPLVSQIIVFDDNKNQIALANNQTTNIGKLFQTAIQYPKRDNQIIGYLTIQLNKDRHLALKDNLLYNTIILFLLIFILIVIIITFYSRKFISKPLNTLEQMMQKVADLANEKKTLNFQLPVSGQNNEITQVSIAFNNIIETIAALVGTVEQKNTDLIGTINHLNELQEMLVESEKMAALGSLVAGVAHEINTPTGIGITAISSGVEIIEKIENKIENKAISKKELISALNSIKIGNELTFKNLKRISKLVASFKQLAVSQSVNELINISVEKFIKDIFNSIQPRFSYCQINFITNISEDLTIKAEEGLLAQVFSNIIINMFIHAFSDKHTGTITLESYSKHNDIFISISDNGRGMNKESLTNIFEPFFTTNRSNGGTGLGMHIVYNIINNKLAGHITCKSQLGIGTTFIIRLPKGEDHITLYQLES